MAYNKLIDLSLLGRAIDKIKALIPIAGTTSPKMDGTAAVGTSAKYAKEDHVHPVDTSRAAASHTHAPENITSGYLNIHPENNPVLIPFIHNDIANLLKRGGSAIVRHDGVQVTKDLTSVFDGSGSYCSYSTTDLASITEIVIELTLHRSFTYSNWVYIDFGNNGWRAKAVKIEAMNSNYANDVWTQKYSTTTNSVGHVSVSTSHTPVGAANAGAGFNKLRFTLSDFAGTQFRISQIGIYNYGSIGLRETYMSRGIDDYVYRNITPANNNTYSLGSSTYRWKDVQSVALNGTTIPASPKFTDTTYESKAAASGGTAVSLVTTGEKYTWNSVSEKADKSATVSTVTYDTTNKKLTKTINGTTTDIVTAQTLNTVFFGRCTTASTEQVKEVTINGITSLTEGLRIIVLFEHVQLFNGTPKLMVNNLTPFAVPIMDNTGSGSGRYAWHNGSVVEMVYVDNYFVITNRVFASTSGYGMVKLDTSTSSTSSLTAATSSAVKAAYDLAASKQDPLESKAAASGGTDLSLVTTGEKYLWNSAASGAGTITGITMNGSSMGTSGVVDLGTVITSANIAYDSTNLKVTQTINGTTTDVLIPQDFNTVFYGLCSTLSSEQVKVADVPGVSELTRGVRIIVNFALAQDYNGQPKLNVNNLGAVGINRTGGTAAAKNEWASNELVEFVYSGTNWVIVSGMRASTSVYGKVMLSNSTSSTSMALAATPYAVKMAYDLASGKVGKTGGTMTGDLIMKSANLTNNTTVPDKTSGIGMSFADTNGTTLGGLMPVFTSDGNQGIMLHAERTISGNKYINDVRLDIGADGFATVYLSAPSVWRTAIGAVNKAGDTMTGNLTIQTSGTQSALYLKNTSADNSASSFETNQYDVVAFLDKNNNNLGYIQTVTRTSNIIEMNIVTRRNVSGTNYDNALTFGVGQNGEKYITVSDPASWITAIGAVPRRDTVGIAEVTGGGETQYVQIATIVITGQYQNYPITFEINGRGIEMTRLTVWFNSINNTDPTLLYFHTDNYTEFWIKKTATSTWVIYGKLNEIWGAMNVHQIIGRYIEASAKVTLNMTRIANSEPTDATKATVGIVYPAAWRTALGAVNIAGDTMTGNLTIQTSGNPSFTLKSTAADSSATTQSTNVYETVGFFDKNGAYIGYVQSILNTDGRSRLAFGARRRLNGSDVTNSFELCVANTGVCSVSMNNPAAWRTALQIIPFKVSTTVLSGSYIRYPVGTATDSNITADHVCMITPYYATSFMNTYFFTCQCAAGYVNIYVRDKSGNQLSAGTTLYLAGIIIKP